MKRDGGGRRQEVIFFIKIEMGSTKSWLSMRRTAPRPMIPGVGLGAAASEEIEFVPFISIITFLPQLPTNCGRF
jgi:hypothetical protein